MLTLVVKLKRTVLQLKALGISVSEEENQPHQATKINNLSSKLH